MFPWANTGTQLRSALHCIGMVGSSITLHEREYAYGYMFTK